MTWFIEVDDDTAKQQCEPEVGATMQIAQGVSILSQSTCTAIMNSNSLPNVTSLLAYLGLIDQITGGA